VVLIKCAYLSSGAVLDIRWIMFKRENLHKSLLMLGISDPGRIFEQLLANYNAKGRYYHTSKHVSDCLMSLRDNVRLATKISEIEVAIWFHDAIYDTHRKDNEELSAVWATNYLSSTGVEGKVVERINNMILCTKTHDADTDDACLMLDIDLGILGSQPDVFEQYDKAVRQEYYWVPEVDYRCARAMVLQSFLNRDVIYKTPEIYKRLEKQARLNLQHKLEDLL
jgi:predicted metal-dependent HD superfamily phosphohydrolase